MIYSDLNQYSPKHDALVTDVDAVRQSIANILATQFGERLFNPEICANLEDELFENADMFAANVILSKVFGAISRWEPRVILVPNLCKVIQDTEDEHIYNVELYFYVKGFEDQYSEMTGVLSI